MGLDWNDTKLGRWFTNLYKRNRNTIAMLTAILSAIAAVAAFIALF